MSTVLSNVWGYATAGVAEGTQRSLRILGYGVASAALAGMADYLSSYTVTNEYGTIGFVTMTYTINIVLGFLNKWAFTTKQKAIEV